MLERTLLSSQVPAVLDRGVHGITTADPRLFAPD
jgi:hypothetical protein